MSISINGKGQRIGLALSGGGFRAAAFHLGVFRKLESLGLLWKLDLLTCVSGGSIAGAFLAANWGKADTLDRLENYLRTRSIAVSSVIGGLLDPFESRLDKLASSYDKDLYGGITLSQLANGPRLYLNATNLATGNMFFFVTGGGKPAEMGEHQLGVTTADDFPLSKAVAASSAFPPVFPPLRIGVDKYAFAEGEYVTLTDGGVYDNLGVNPLLRERNELDYALISDGGKPFENNDRPTESGTAVLYESINILMEQVRGLQFKRLELAHLSGKGPKPLWFSIDSQIGESQPGDSSFASAISTNLKKLGPAEMAVLTRHAGALLDHRLKTYANELLTA
ncbi:MAG: patatin-like phospholipase family protein [Gammaproteobacteria bacterium]|nr:patatin-like phospholipase family protein [Rhodocyclaceae bacterium]MBU3908629.1 patatin-like phospholipase family protein [Gammaproteobacteria bacterium]MBU3988552.1 patatin-like phospholipase family protein [Gammaproteobacteria bacterium]MBU4004657.1 patatin-like phospholipase family protein [Gammaproteobacteria bacterium]MBU4021260.1 patatin-like phospholipase family protein [Gammaproteobacteria bacterium]